VLIVGSPLFSVIVPTYNRSDLVRLAIETILKQTFQDFEVVVSDNWSEDDTIEVVQGFGDARIRCVRPPQHLPLPDHWEWARAQGDGRLEMMLSDDDALSPIALERFADVHRCHGADFMFSSFAEYRDQSYPGPFRNTLECAPFPGTDRVVRPAEFVGTLFSFRPIFNMHPTAFVFSADLANTIARRRGRFFKTIGVEYYAWPIAAALARRAFYVGVPLTITGRASKSWGTNMVLINPGEKKIEQFISDVSKAPRIAPLSNYTFVNLMAEGILRAKQDFPEELGAFEFDKQVYLRLTLAELLERRSRGVDVSGELQELAAYRLSHPELEPLEETVERPPFSARLRDAGRRRTNRARNRIRGLEAGRGFSIQGSIHGFSNIIECGDLLAEIVMSPTVRLRRQAQNRFDSAVVEAQRRATQHRTLDPSARGRMRRRPRLKAGRSQ
jgi:glycosyl transferase family 2